MNATLYRKDVTNEEFYESQVYSGWAMATGNSGYTFFQGTEAETHRNYNTNTNLFDTGQGRIVTAHVVLYETAYALPVLVTGATTTVADEWFAMVSRAVFEFKVGSTTVHRQLLQGMTPSAPGIQLALTSGANSVLTQQGVGANGRNAVHPGMKFFTPPLEVPPGQSIRVVCTLPQAVNALNTYIMQLVLGIEENPQPTTIVPRTL
ncbi:MAG: hypothetical protein KDG50_03210 [Chromatiales bacterium]|nr:hypothetical protein [Chromatiales bacterium]